MSEVVFLSAQPEDEPNVRKLLTASGLPDEDIAPHLQHFILAKAGAELVGCIGLETAGDYGLLRSLAVASSHRSRGLGAQLSALVEDQARGRGFRTLYLMTTTAAQYFERRGYEPVDRELAPGPIRTTRQFTSLCPSTAVLMKITL